MSQPKTVGWLVLPDGFREIRQNAICAPPRTERCRRIASLLERLSTSRFPFRHPVLHGLILELCSFAHRTRLLWKRGDTRSVEMGSVWELDAQQHLVPNRRTQARNADIQKLFSEYPWCSPEDWHVFLLGWDAGSEWRKNYDTAETGDDTQQDSFCPPSRGRLYDPACQ
jgi:hypothetical protein